MNLPITLEGQEPAASSPEAADERAAARQTKPTPLNGIPATWQHDEGAYAQCGTCNRYSLDPQTLRGGEPPECACGDRYGWSGSFKRPGPDAKWNGAAPVAALASAPAGAGEGASEKPVKLPCCGYYDRTAVMWNPWNEVVQCHNCGAVYELRAALAGEPAVAADEGRDAARYRWLRDVGDATWRPFGIREGYSAAQADAAIDAAIARAASQDEQQEKQG